MQHVSAQAHFLTKIPRDISLSTIFAAMGTTKKQVGTKTSEKDTVPSSAATNAAGSQGSSVPPPAPPNDDPNDEAKATPLICLNEATGKFGTWEVCVVNPRMQNYTYIWQGQERKGTNFRCTLVSIEDDTQYC